MKNNPESIEPQSEEGNYNPPVTSEYDDPRYVWKYMVDNYDPFKHLRLGYVIYNKKEFKSDNARGIVDFISKRIDEDLNKETFDLRDFDAIIKKVSLMSRVQIENNLKMEQYEPYSQIITRTLEYFEQFKNQISDNSLVILTDTIHDFMFMSDEYFTTNELFRQKYQELIDMCEQKRVIDALFFPDSIIQRNNEHMFYNATNSSEKGNRLPPHPYTKFNIHKDFMLTVFKSNGLLLKKVEYENRNENIQRKGHQLQLQLQAPESDKNAVSIDFTPHNFKTAEEGLHRQFEIMKMLYWGIKNLFDAIDNGDIEITDDEYLVGTTNYEMAMFAQRFGFEIFEQGVTARNKMDAKTGILIPNSNKSENYYSVRIKLGELRKKMGDIENSRFGERLNRL